jgi:hypothetical protein
LFVGGQLVPLSVPFVARTNLPGAWKGILSGLLLISPELFLLAAVAVLGKPGFDYLTGAIKKALGRFFERHGPPERVSRRRYRVGLAMFLLPLLFGWLAPYAGHHFPAYEEHRLLYAIPGDVLLLLSLFVLGGEFWDKLRSLFIHGARAQFPSPSGSE